MLYFKNTELAEKYHVSLRTVLNWIEAAIQHKLDLELYEDNGRSYIANTTRNVRSIENMVEERRKYRNKRGAKAVTPQPKFYEIYDQHQILDITSSLDTYHEIPFQYCYFDEGAVYWDKYSHRLATENTPNFLTSTHTLFDLNMAYIEAYLAPYSRVNVIDIGPGNLLPLKNILTQLIDQKKLGRYIALDISQSMLDIVGNNFKNWFGDAAQYEGHTIDINYDRFGDFLADEVVGEKAEDTINLVFFLGGTLSNTRSPDNVLKVIHDSMGRKDLLIYVLKLDSDASRRYFDFGADAKLQPLDPQAKIVTDLMGIDESFYDVEMGYDHQYRQRYIRLRLKIALSIKFAFKKGERIIDFNKGDSILLWRYWHQDPQTVLKQLNSNDFDVLQSSMSESKEYLLTISRPTGSGPD